ncbi:MAG: M28 family peptidase [Bacteroidetes bacterium]|nr:M28 family peptidase [Bacteroidota bacterium]MCL2301998.1 M28 family peptidase [Lentimicrobiaceae bacterium]
MKKFIFVLALWLSVFCTFSQQPFSMEKAVRYLASPELEGRFIQTKGDSLAIEYLVSQFEMMEIQPFFNQYAQPFCGRSFFTGRKDTICSRNVVAFVEGTDKKLKEQYILVCAHFDHLGKKENEYFPGANDNASGTAMVLYLANYFAKNPTKRSIIFACFAGEELGFLGSSSFIKVFPEPLDQIQYVINFDMVGRYDEGGLCVIGESTSKILKETVQKISEKEQIRTKKSSFIFFFGSDHFVFYQQKIPFLCFNTGGDKKNYHTPKDDVDSIDFEGMKIVATFGKQVIEELGNSSKKSDFKKMDSKK